MKCSDCAERAADIKSLNNKFGNKPFNHDCLLPLVDILGDANEFLKTMKHRKFSDRDIRPMTATYDRLKGTRIHYRNVRYQLLLRSEMSKNLSDNCGVLIFDFGANIVCGHK